VAEQFSWTPREKEESKEKYGCEILVERAKKDQLNSTQFPSDSYIVEYKVKDETFHDLTRGTQVTLFDMYYDKFKSQLISINYGKGNIKPALWLYRKPKEKKKRR
tara:strand:- start:28 stop:342 length:315 start_codon:yes stop_codon:yes gene_type:complete